MGSPPGDTGPTGVPDGSSLQYACMEGPDWSWCNPSPTGATLDAVWGSAEDDVWAVGAGGLAEHWDGKTWSIIPTLTAPDQELFSVWGTDATNVWAVGSNAHGSAGDAAEAIILHWDGTTWLPSLTVPTSALWSVWGSDANHVWAVGGASNPTAGLILFWNGTTWMTTASTSASVLYGVAGTAANEVWAVGNRYVSPDASTGPGSFIPEILNWNGASWTVSYDDDGAASTSLPLAVWPVAPDDVWVATAGAPLHWNGFIWQPAPLPPPATGGPTAFGGTGSGDLWGTLGSAMAHWTGSSWQQPYDAVTGIGSPGMQPVTLNGVWASSATDAWSVGAGGAIAHFDGTGWSSESPMPEFRSAAAITANDAWTVGTNGAAWHWNGSAWTPTTTGTTSTLTAVWAAASNDVWTLAQDATVHRWGGFSWTTQGGTPAGPLVAIGGTSSNDVWVSNGPGNTGDAGTGPPTNTGQLSHFTASGWQASAVPLGSATASWVEAIWAIDPGNVWAVGYQARTDASPSTTALIANWNGTTWSLVDTQLSASAATAYNSVWGTGMNDVWVAGSAAGSPDGGMPKTAAVAHWDGVAWTDETLSGGLTTLVGTGALWGSGPNDVWLWGYLAGSANESVFHWDGSTWSQSFTLPDVWSYGNAITGTGPSDLWTVGSGGMILHHL